jgi:pSer/pThr/pTyr-binding forkhead associated (FHA) protein
LDRTGHFFPIREGRNTIGKGDNARLKINDPLLSEEHAVILYRNSQFIFEDRLSSNGSILNGEEAVGQINLKHGDVLKLGSNEFVLLVVPRITS